MTSDRTPDQTPAQRTPFHLVVRGRNPWLGLAELLLVAVFFLVCQVAAVVVLLSTSRPGSFLVDKSSMLDVFALAATVAATFLAAWMTRRDPQLLLSVAGRIRWPIVGRAALIAVPVYAALLLIDLTAGEAVVTPTTVVLALAFVLAVPVQAAAEELLFRAALPQIVGQWVRSPFVAYGVAAIPFVALHIYNWIGLVDIAVFAICAAWLTWRTNGIEAAVVLHAASNIAVFVSEALHPQDPILVDAAWSDVLPSIVVTLALTAAIGWSVTRQGSRSPASPLPR